MIRFINDLFLCVIVYIKKIIFSCSNISGELCVIYSRGNTFSLLCSLEMDCIS